MEKRIIIVEDDLVNMICALQATNDTEVKEAKVVATFEDAIELIETLNPTHALLDIHIKGRGTGRDLGNILKKKGVPYVYVTGTGDIDHNRLDGIEIQDEEKTLFRFDGEVAKTQEIWRKAYELIR